MVNKCENRNKNASQIKPIPSIKHWNRALVAFDREMAIHINMRIAKCDTAQNKVNNLNKICAYWHYHWHWFFATAIVIVTEATKVHNRSKHALTR